MQKQITPVELAQLSPLMVFLESFTKARSITDVNIAVGIFQQDLNGVPEDL